MLEARGEAGKATAHDIFGPDFLIRRPLLQALDARDGVAPVLLIDEIDRADEEFEAYLLEILSDFQVTVPEIGTIRAERTPRVILTSNRTREVHDALKRRCLYHWIDYPSFERELEIVLTRVPARPALLARQIVAFIHRLREADLTKVPGVAETLDWAAALLALGAAELSPVVVDETLGVVLKYEEDVRGRPGRGQPADARGARGRRLAGRAARPCPTNGSRRPSIPGAGPSGSSRWRPPAPARGSAVDGRRFVGRAVRFARELRLAGLATDLGAAIDFSRRSGSWRSAIASRSARPARRSSSGGGTRSRSTTRSSTGSGGPGGTRLPAQDGPLPALPPAGRGARGRGGGGGPANGSERRRSASRRPKARPGRSTTARTRTRRARSTAWPSPSWPTG